MEFRPLNYELAIACMCTRFCRDCTCRHGCPVRKSFYEGDFEIPLQMAELKLRECTPNEVAYTLANDLRKKRADELRLHKFFEY